MAVHLSGGMAGGVGDIIGISQRRTNKGFVAEEPPSAFDDIEPGGTDGNEGLLNTQMISQPSASWAIGVAGQVVSDAREIATWTATVKRLQHREVAAHAE